MYFSNGGKYLCNLIVSHLIFLGKLLKNGSLNDRMPTKKTCFQCLCRFFFSVQGRYM